MLPIYRDRPIVNAAYLVVTEQCNLRCKYCYETHGTRRMSEEVAFAGIDFLFRNSTKSRESIDITFFGGEPTLEADLIYNSVTYAVKKSREYGKPVSIGMVTNCVMLPDTIRDVITKYGKEIFFNIQMSIDGPEDVQNAYRVFPDGITGSWFRVTETIDKWVEIFNQINHGMLGIHGCFNKVTLPKLYESYRYFREDRGLEKIWNIPVSEEKWDEHDVDVYREQLTKIKDHIIKKCYERKSYDEIPLYSPLSRCIENHGPRCKPCGAGVNFVSITPDGSISPCHQMHFNIPDSKIGDVWSGIDEDRRRLFVEYEESDLPCTEKGCPQTQCYRCIANNYDHRGCMFSIHDEMFCRMMMVDYDIQKELKEFFDKRLF